MGLINTENGSERSGTPFVSGGSDLLREGAGKEAEASALWAMPRATGLYDYLLPETVGDDILETLDPQSRPYILPIDGPSDIAAAMVNLAIQRAGEAYPAYREVLCLDMPRHVEEDEFVPEIDEREMAGATFAALAFATLSDGMNKDTYERYFGENADPRARYEGYQYGRMCETWLRFVGIDDVAIRALVMGPRMEYADESGTFPHTRRDPAWEAVHNEYVRLLRERVFNDAPYRLVVMRISGDPSRLADSFVRDSRREWRMKYIVMGSYLSIWGFGSRVNLRDLRKRREQTR